MPTNLELKVKLKSFDEVKKILNNINAEFIHILIQKDVYYKIPDGLLKLRIENSDSSLLPERQSLIKYNRDEKGADRFSDYEVLNFSSGKTEKFFNSIFKIEAVVQKKRQLYLFENTRVHLDEVKGLGKFLELETLVIKGKTDAKKRFDFIKKTLMLDDLDEIKKSYRDLIIARNNKK
jgi:predicted adenylyl cyclase CyaB